MQTVMLFLHYDLETRGVKKDCTVSIRINPGKLHSILLIILQNDIHQ